MLTIAYMCVYFIVQTSCAVRNSGISLNDQSALMAYNARFSCVHDFAAPFPKLYGLKMVTNITMFVSSLKGYFDFFYVDIWTINNISTFATVAVVVISKIVTISMQSIQFEH